MVLPIFTDEDPLRRLRKSAGKDALRKMERMVGKVSKPAGDVLEKVNNILDSIDNVTDRPCIQEYSSAMSAEKALHILQKGDHIKCNRTLYSHHGIYIGDGQVIAYDDSIVKQCSLEEFADGNLIFRVEEVEEKAAYSPDQIVMRARSRVGETDYNLLFNNSENFATWCRCGRE